MAPTPDAWFCVDNYGKFLQKRLHTLFREGHICDLALSTDTKHGSVSFHIHKVVLYMSSEYFKKQVQDGLDVRSSYIIPDVNAHALETLIHFMYTGNLRMNEINADMILQSATFLQMDIITETYSSFKKGEASISKQSEVSLSKRVVGTAQSTVDKPRLSRHLKNKRKQNVKESILVEDMDGEDEHEHEHGAIRENEEGDDETFKPSIKKYKKSPKKASKCKGKYFINSIKLNKLKMHKQRTHLKNKNIFLLKKRRQCVIQLSAIKLLKMQGKKMLKKSFKCVLCKLKGKERKFRFYSQFLKHYEEMHQKKLSYCCSLCSKSFRSYIEVRLHTSTKHTKVCKPNVLKCQTCAQPFLHARNLLHHLSGNEHPKLKRARKSQSKSGIRSKKKPVKKGSFQCEEKTCDFVTNNRQTLKHHVQEKHPNVKLSCPVTNCRFVGRSRTEIEHHMMGKHEKTRGMLCDLCSKWFPKSIGLRIHMFVKHKIRMDGIKTFSCDEDGCDYVTVSKHGISKHKGYKHTKASFQCTYCDKILKTALTMKKHVNKMHLGIRPFLCTVCGQAFGEEYDLKHHEQRHSVKDRKCQHCAYTSASEHDYNHHMFSAHKIKIDESKKVYKCSQCDYSTLIRNRLKNHHESHNTVSNYKCQHCHKLFKTVRTLKKHVSFVHQPKSYPCTHCAHVAHSLHHLKEHCRVKHTHKDLKPYKCGYCNFHSATTGNCRKHVMGRHKGMEVLYIKVEELPKLGPPRPTLSQSDNLDSETRFDRPQPTSKVSQVKETSQSGQASMFIPLQLVYTSDAPPSCGNSTVTVTGGNIHARSHVSQEILQPSNLAQLAVQHPMTSHHIPLASNQFTAVVNQQPTMTTSLPVQTIHPTIHPTVHPTIHPATNITGHHQTGQYTTHSINVYSSDQTNQIAATYYQQPVNVDIDLGALVNNAISNSLQYSPSNV